MRIKPISLRHLTRPLDDLLNIDNPNFEGIVTQIYPPDLKLNKASTSDTEAPFLQLHLSISNVFSSKINDKRDGFDFDIVDVPFWMAMFNVALLWSVYFSTFKGSPITKALTCMKIYLYKQKWQFCQRD